MEIQIEMKDIGIGLPVTVVATMIAWYILANVGPTGTKVLIILTVCLLFLTAGIEEIKYARMKRSGASAEQYLGGIRNNDASDDRDSFALSY